MTEKELARRVYTMVQNARLVMNDRDLLEGAFFAIEALCEEVVVDNTYRYWLQQNDNPYSPVLRQWILYDLQRDLEDVKLVDFIAEFFRTGPDTPWYSLGVMVNLLHIDVVFADGTRERKTFPYPGSEKGSTWHGKPTRAHT